MHQTNVFSLFVHEGVRMLQSVGGMDGSSDDGLEGKHFAVTPGALGHVTPSQAFQHLHRDEVGALCSTQFENLHDVWMRQPRSEPGLTQKQGHRTLIAGQVRLHELDADLFFEAAKALRGSGPDVAHTALSEEFGESVAPQFLQDGRPNSFMMQTPEPSLASAP